MNTRSAARCRWRRILPKTRHCVLFCFFDGCALGNKKLCSYRHCRKEPEGLWYFDGKTRVGWREGLYFQPVAINEPWQQKHKGPCGVLWRVVCRDGTGSGGPKIKRQRPSVWLRRRTRFRSLSLSVDWRTRDVSFYLHTSFLFISASLRRSRIVWCEPAHPVYVSLLFDSLGLEDKKKRKQRTISCDEWRALTHATTHAAGRDIHQRRNAIFVVVVSFSVTCLLFISARYFVFYNQFLLFGFSSARHGTRHHVINLACARLDVFLPPDATVWWTRIGCQKRMER